MPFQLAKDSALLSRPSRAAWEGLSVRIATVSPRRPFLTVGLRARKKPTVNYPARQDELTVATAWRMRCLVLRDVIERQN